MKGLLSISCSFLLAVTLSVTLAGCFMTATVRESLDERPPLSYTEPVTIVYASEVPVLPENLELVATMGGLVEDACIVGYHPNEWTYGLEREARKLGANVVYVKVPGPNAPCKERTVEFLVKKSGGNDEKN